jgi:hypothetical protein
LDIRGREDETPDGALPYCVEVWDRRGERRQAVLGRLRGAGLGFACYYGAVREYVDRRIVLRNGEQVLASFEPPSPLE